MSDLGDALLQGLGEAIAHLRGEDAPCVRVRTVEKIPDEIDVAAIRTKLERFAFARAHANRSRSLI